MTKKQLAWLIVRVIGVFSLYNALKYAFIVFENVMMTSNIDNGNVLLEKGAGLISGWIVEGIVYLLIGLYLIIDGRVLFNLFNRESNEDEEEISIKFPNA